MSEVVLVDNGGANIGSVRYALARMGVDATLTVDAARIRAASHVILPGVGAAGEGMRRLRERRLDDVLRELDQPVLGICLGMQLLFEHSAEGNTECLGVLPAAVRRLDGGPDLRLPHMGWNRVRAERNDALLAGCEATAGFAYFVHSYAAPVGEYTIASSDYGQRFSAIVRRGNFCGMQFHPERSSALGARLLKNFLSL
jgi:glutamine amidotransferase